MPCRIQVYMSIKEAISKLSPIIRNRLRGARPSNCLGAGGIGIGMA